MKNEDYVNLPDYVCTEGKKWYEKRVIKKNYPELYNEVVEKYKEFDISWTEAFYLYVYGKDKPCGFCKYCGKPIEFYSWKRGYQDYCSAGCASRGTREKSVVTLKEHYPKGSEARKELTDKLRQKSKDIYGVDWFSQSKEVREKINNTNIERYGVYCPSKSEIVKETARKNNLAKYGVESPSSLDWVKEKRTATINERYHVDNVFQAEEIKEKSKQTCLDTYGCEYASQSEVVKEKVRQTCLEKFGVEYSSQSPEIKEKVKQTCLDKFGVEYAGSSPEIIAKRVKTRMDNFVKEHDFLTGITIDGEWECVCPHLGSCDQCKEKTYIVSSKQWYNRKYEGTEPCTKLKPIGAIGPTDIELMMIRILKRLNIEYKFNDDKHIKLLSGRGWQLDFFLEKFNIAIETNGIWWHSVEKDPLNQCKHYWKWKTCKENGIELLYFWSDQKEEDIEEFLKRKLITHEPIDEFKTLWYPSLKSNEHPLDLGWCENMNNIQEYFQIRSNPSYDYTCYSAGIAIN